jgi:hypothetical protein
VLLEAGLDANGEPSQRYGYALDLEHLLTRLVQNPHFLRLLANPRFSEDGVLRDDGDGSTTRTHPLCRRYPDAIRLRLYYDDVQLTNPTSTYTTTVGKIEFFFFQGVDVQRREEREKIPGKGL